MSYTLSDKTRAVLEYLERARIEHPFCYDLRNVGEATDTLDSRAAGRTRFPETAGRLRVHEREVS